jgi:predicted MPP superfamily phosphohydrolase
VTTRTEPRRIEQPETLLPPRPSGWLHPQTSRFARLLAYAVAVVNRGLDALPPVRAVYRRQVERSLEVSEHAVPVAGPRLRIAFFSDLHAGSYLRERDLERVFARVSEAGVDVAVLGGDLVNSYPRELEMVCRAARAVHAPLGTFAVPGNHEHFWGPGLSGFVRVLEDHGIVPLVNAGHRIEVGGESVWLCGVDEWSEGRPDVGSALAGRRAGEATVLVSHHPDVFDAAAAAGVDLQLSGHTHGGQLCLFGWVPMRHSVLGYLRGAYSKDGATLYVGRGVGATILPLRVGARPEVPIVTLQPAERGHAFGKDSSNQAGYSEGVPNS